MKIKLSPLNQKLFIWDNNSWVIYSENWIFIWTLWKYENSLRKNIRKENNKYYENLNYCSIFFEYSIDDLNGQDTNKLLKDFYIILLWFFSHICNRIIKKRNSQVVNKIKPVYSDAIFNI